MKTRNLKYETIRVIAMLFVIIIHEMTTIIDQNSYSYLFVATILFICNPFFFMLSGKYSFDIDYEDKNYILKFYKKKFINLIVPILIYMFIRHTYIFFTRYDYNLIESIVMFIPRYFYLLLFEFNVTEYWFIYSLIANILVVPFVGKFVVNASKKDASIFILLMLFFNLLTTFLGYYDIKYEFVYSFGGRSIFFYLGYFVDKFYSNKKDKTKIYVLGIISFIAISIMLKFFYPVNVWTYSILYTFFVVAAYSFIRDNIKLEKIKGIILFLGKYSLSIYMLHLMFINIYNNIIPKSICIPFLYATLIIIFTLISSSICGYIIDNTVIKYIRNKISKFKTMKIS